ncbi:Pre-mRNA-splicing factor Cwf15/Cwc15 [Cubamyces menziesii]|nr:Pre-mRNA-splicing factor Cwf15/Cwc15 [Cubamyces menziesii]
MSTAHRPTWDPAQAKDVKGGSRQFSVRDMAAHTKLKFRQPGQTSAAEVAKRDLRAELLAAEAEARDRKRKAEGKPPLAVENGSAKEGQQQDEESNKRRKLLQEALELDKDDDDEDEKSEKGENEDADESDEDEDEDDDEDDTAELLRELEKIKRERAEEKERQEREQSASVQAQREVEIATANPLLNLAAALGQSPNGVNTTKPGTFAVKRRWDDDLIFKNQAVNIRDKDKDPQFVNDLLRTEFHKKFMAKFIKVCPRLDRSWDCSLTRSSRSEPSFVVRLRPPLCISSAWDIAMDVSSDTRRTCEYPCALY